MTDATAPVSENAPAPFADVPQVDAETPVRVRFAPSPTGTAACIARPRSLSSRAVVDRSSAPAAHKAVYSPRLCPAT